MTNFEFPNKASEFVFVRTYARWLEDEGRRETWVETVDRYIEFIESHVGDRVPQKVFRKAKEAILNMRAMPSMRAMWAAGPAGDATNVALYNCAFAVIDSIESFAECLYILMCGTGFGFSVQNKYIEKLPEVPTLTAEGAGTFIIPDSKEGWADSIKKLMQALYAGKDLSMDYNLLRLKGARLKTFGGRSSGPAPLLALHEFIRHVFEKAQGRKLKSIECLDILNKIAEIVVVGGVRRSSQISFSDLSDQEMAQAKVWPFPMHRSMSNNSAIYEEKPGAVKFLEEWALLAKSGTGERGISNIEGARKRAPERRDAKKIMGSNPCHEIMLRDCQFCNLSEVVARPGDDLDDILKKIETAVWLGAIQSTFTKFPYLRRKWRRNCEEERLLGVSITGQMDNAKLFTDDALDAMLKKALKICAKACKILDINMSVAITCTKPSGTVSQLVNSSSGLHPRFSKHYIRRYRISSIDPLFRMLVDQKFPIFPENGQREEDWKKAQEGDQGICTIYEKGKRWTKDKVNTWVVSFPVESPKKSVTKEQVTALQQLEHYKKIQSRWCEHSASCTIYVKPQEWFEVGNWVYNNWKYITGVSFLPFDGGEYEQAPYEEIDKSKFEQLVKELPDIDYSQLSKYEKEDNTTGAKTMACTGNSCDL